MSTPQQQSWVEYYQRLYATENTYLDYSNVNVQGQTYGIAIEAAGPLGGKRCMDIGCGRGQISLALAALQSREVVGVDIMAESISVLRARYPHVRWEVGSPEDAGFCESLGKFDVILIIELLQLVEWRKAIRVLWNQIAPGGRFVAIVPNKDNAIVQKVVARFAGSYIAPNPAELAALVGELPDVDCWAYRGMDFQQDQRIVPYATSPWTSEVMQDFASNRLVIVIQKQGSTADPTPA